MASLTPAPPTELAFRFLRQRAPRDAAGGRRDRDSRALLLDDRTARPQGGARDHRRARRRAGVRGRLVHLMPETELRELIDIVHAHDVLVSTRTSCVAGAAHLA